MGITLSVLAYGVCIIFWIRFALNVLVLYKGSYHTPVRPSRHGKHFVKICFAASADIFLFRRLFRTNPLLWSFSWTFHISLFFVVLRHLRFIFEPVPEWVVFIQPLGIIAGYVLPLSLVFIIFLRIPRDRLKYVSYGNLFILCLLFFISTSGLLIKTYFRTDLVRIKEFAIGLAICRPEALPDSYLFVVHFLLVLLLVPYLPSHIFTAPFVTVEAVRREEELNLVLHEK